MPHTSARHLTGADTAMTEIALALAMAFFSILVLALVSMGAGQSPDPSAEEPGHVLTAALIPPGQDGAATVLESRDVLIVYHAGRFLGRDLTPLSDGALNALAAVDAGDGRLVLAVPPDLPLGETMAARSRIDRPDLLITALNADWMARLTEATKAGLKGR